MNEEISVTIRNNTSQVQPVTLFTEQFAIPSNLTGGQTQIYSWDLSNESFFYSFDSPIAQIQIDTSPINGLTPYTFTGALPTNDISGLVAALNLLGLGTFTNVGSILTVTSSIYFYGSLLLTQDIYQSVTSSTANVQPALQLIVNGTLTTTIPSGVNVNIPTSGISSNDIIQVLYNVGAGAISWVIQIENYLPPPALPINIFNQTGVGAFSGSYTFSYPNSGNIQITLNITP